MFEARRQVVPYPSGEPQAARFDGLGCQQRVVEAAEPQSHDQDHRQVERDGQVGHGVGVVEGGHPPTCTLRYNQIATSGKLVECAHDRFHFDSNARFCRRYVR